MLIAGAHFNQDLAGNKDIWKIAFEKENIYVTLEKKDSGFIPILSISSLNIFRKHLM